MAEVSVKINNKAYGIACDEGQEERVRQLGQYVNERLMSVSAGAASEVQSFVLTSIILADEIADMQDYIAKLEEERKVQAEPQVEIREVEVIKEVIKEVPVEVKVPVEVIKEVVKEVPVEVKVPVDSKDSALSLQDVEDVADMVVSLTGRIKSMSDKLAKAA